MKKKNIEKQSAERLERIEMLEGLLRRRRTEIKLLEGEIKGKNEIIAILESIIYQLVDEKGCVEVSRAKLSEGIRHSFTIEAKEDVFVLCSGRSENSEQIQS